MGGYAGLPGLMPGSNFGGSNVAVPTPNSPNTPAVGGNQSPFVAPFPSGQGTPSASSPMNFNPTSMWGFDATGVGGPGTPFNEAADAKSFVKAMYKSGINSGIAGKLYEFLKSGAGFNPQVAQALFAAMAPQIQRGEADILEQFSGMGLRSGSPAAIGMGDYLSQVNLNQGQIMAGLYQQAVQNYLSVLMGTKHQPPTGVFDNIMKYVSTMAGSFESAAKGAAAL